MTGNMQAGDVQSRQACFVRCCLNVFSAVGIGLTFLASVAAVIVSIISLRYSNNVAKRSGYLSIFTASRDKKKT